MTTRLRPTSKNRWGWKRKGAETSFFRPQEETQASVLSVKEALSVTGTWVAPFLRLRVKLQEAGREVDQPLSPSGHCISEGEGSRQESHWKTG